MKEKYQIKCPFCKKNIMLTVAQKYERSAVANEIMRQTRGLREALVRCKKQLKAGK